MDEQDSNSGWFGCWRRLADADRTHGPFTDGSSLTQAGDQLWQVFSAHAFTSGGGSEGFGLGWHSRTDLEQLPAEQGRLETKQPDLPGQGRASERYRRIS